MHDTRADPSRSPALAEGRWSTEQFRSHLAADGHPLQQRVSEHQVEVTFVLETAGTIADNATVQLRELVGSGHTGDRVLAPVGSSGFRALTVRMHSDLRMAYVFVVHEDDAAPRMLPDPLNPPLPTEDTRLAGSVLELPDAVELPFAPQRLDGPLPGSRSTCSPAPSSAMSGASGCHLRRAGAGRSRLPA